MVVDIYIKYDGNISYTLTITFSNFGITPIHEAIEGDNQYGFGDTTYEELKNSGWKVDSNSNKVSSSNGKVSFTNVGGNGGVDATLEIKNGFDKNDGDLLYTLSLMLNSYFEAEKLDNDIQEAYDGDTTHMGISGKYSMISVNIPEDRSSVKITFDNIYSNNIDQN